MGKASKHAELLQVARNDIDVLDGMMRRELERPFDYLAAMVMRDA